MNLSNRDKALLLGLAGFLLAVAAYVLVFVPFSDKADVANSELEALKTREAELVELEQNMEVYQKQIQELTVEKEELIARFPADILPESEIMYAVELEERAPMKFSSLLYGTPTVIAEDTTGTGLNACCIPMSMTYQTSYQGLKNAITYTLEKSDRMVIDAVTASYDGTTGNLIGNMTLNMYYVNGTGKTYVEPFVPDMPMGTGNIFGTIE